MLRRIFRRCFVQVETLARKHPFVFAVVTVTLLFALVIWAMPPAYQTNDDAVMSMIAAGHGISLEPDEHLVFTNVLIGKLLKFLYTRYPDMLWYGWYLVATQWGATIGLMYCFLRPRHSRLRMLGFVTYFFTAGIYFLVNLQFTSTSILAGITGVMLLLQMLQAPAVGSWERFTLPACALFLMVWGGLIRNESFILSMLLASPVLLAAYRFGTATRRAGVVVCSVLALATSLIVLAGVYHQKCYHEPGWQAFGQYNPLRIKFNDESWITYTPESKHVFDQVGWNENDFQMIQMWYYDDPIYDHQTLNTIVTGHPWKQHRKPGVILLETISSIYKQHTVLAICFCVPGILLLIERGPRWHWSFVVAAVTTVGILLAIALLRKAPPERVFMPILAFPWLVLINSIGMYPRNDEPKTISRIIQCLRTAWQFKNWSWSYPGWSKQLMLRTVTILLAIGLSANISKLHSKGKHNTKNVIHYNEILADLRSAGNEPERLILTLAADFPFEYKPALFGKDDCSGLRIYSVGWLQRTPHAERMKQHFKIQSLGQALADKHDMLLIMNSSSYCVLMQYLADHYSDDLRMVNLKNYPRSSLSKIESLQSFGDDHGSESAALNTKLNLDSQNSRK